MIDAFVVTVEVSSSILNLFLIPFPPNCWRAPLSHVTGQRLIYIFEFSIYWSFELSANLSHIHHEEFEVFIVEPMSIPYVIGDDSERSRPTGWYSMEVQDKISDWYFRYWDRRCSILNKDSIWSNVLWKSDGTYNEPQLLLSM